MSRFEVLPDDSFDTYYPLICHKIQLLRLGSERVDCEASSLLSDINSTSDHCRKSKFVGNKVVTEAEVYHHNKSLSIINHTQTCYHSNSNHERIHKKCEEVELHYVKMPNQDENVVAINESKVCDYVFYCYENNCIHACY